MEIADLIAAAGFSGEIAFKSVAARTRFRKTFWSGSWPVD